MRGRGARGAVVGARQARNAAPRDHLRCRGRDQHDAQLSGDDGFLFFEVGGIG